LERALNKLYLFSPEERSAHILRTNSAIHNRHTIKSLLIMLSDKFYPLAVEDVFFFYTYNEKVTAYTHDGKQHPVSSTLDALNEQLDESLFFRANRQFIISRKAIKDVGLWFGSRLSVNLTIAVPERIIISKMKSPLFKKWILREG
jgi:two-component system LytT family response regulator